MRTIEANVLTKAAFAPFGDVIEVPGGESFAINGGMCVRHHALAATDVQADGGHAIVSIFRGQPYPLPHRVGLVERHPLGSQAFYPLNGRRWLVIVCDDDGGHPVRPRAFLATGNQGINIGRNVWHGVLTPLDEPSDFLVVDRAGPGDNLEEYELPEAERFVVTV